MLPGPPGEGEHASGSTTLCQSWPDTHGDTQVISVRCYTAGGRLIQCCGHGLLAAAHGWHRLLDCHRVTLDMNGSRVPSWRQDGDTWLQFRRVTTKPCPVPGWIAQVFPDQRQPVVAVSSGGEQGYLVVQWPDNHDLHTVRPNVSRLSEATARALICTAAQPEEGEDTIQLRYFAPQYGVPEDDATGSAMRVLAGFWSSRFASLTARQCSSGGGLLFARWTPDHVEVGGRCVDLETVVTHA